MVCSDAVEHRRRVEERQSDIPGFRLPTWEAVVSRHYMPWNEPHLVIDTAHVGPGDMVALVEAEIERVGPKPDSGGMNDPASVEVIHSKR